MADYRLSPQARRDLEMIWKYSFEQWGMEQANRYVDKIVAKFDAVASDPPLSPACDHIRSGYCRCIAERHMIYFRANGKTVDIIRILHAQMDAARHL